MVTQERDSFSADFCAERLKALGDPLRLKVIDLLRHGEMTVGDISEFLETPLVGISHHLQILKHAQLVSTRRDGRYIYYSLETALLKSSRSRRSFNLGCCRLEIADPAKRS